MLKGPVIIVPGPVRSATIIRGVSNPSVWFCKLNDPVVRDPGSGAWYCIPLRVFRGYSFDSLVLGVWSVIFRCCASFATVVDSRMLVGVSDIVVLVTRVRRETFKVSQTVAVIQMNLENR